MKISVFSSSFLFVLSLFISSYVGLTLSPTSLSKQSGSYSTAQSLSVLSTKDLSGTADDWDKYIEFYGNSQVFRGTFSFDVSSVVNVVSAFSLKVNYKGPTKSNQVWTWEWFNPTTNTYVAAGDNTGATNWVWSSLSFNGPLPFANFVSTSKVLQVRFSSATVADNCNIDFLQLDVTTTTSVPSTLAPTTTPTSAPTTKPTSAPTTKPTSAPTTKPTSAPTTKPTSAPTTKPTSAPTTKPTSAPTTKPTSQPTNAPTTGRKCPAGKRYVPEPGTTFHIQYTETINYNKNVQVYNIDMFDSATVANVNALHARGVAVICYFSSQYESWRSDASKFTSTILGNPLDEWPGERWVDIRTQTLRNIMTDRLDIAVARGCDGVDVDNVDEYTNTNGLGLTYADQLNFNIFMANEAHARGLSIGLKNDLDQIEDLVSYYDFAVNEQCNQYNECNYMDPFVQDNKAVFGIEYSGSHQTFCPNMNLKDFTFVYKALSLNEAATNCCTYEQGGCTNSATYRCE